MKNSCKSLFQLNHADSSVFFLNDRITLKADSLDRKK